MCMYVCIYVTNVTQVKGIEADKVWHKLHQNSFLQWSENKASQEHNSPVQELNSQRCDCEPEALISEPSSSMGIY